MAGASIERRSELAMAQMKLATGTEVFRAMRTGAIPEIDSAHIGAMAVRYIDTLDFSDAWWIARVEWTIGEWCQFLSTGRQPKGFA